MHHSERKEECALCNPRTYQDARRRRYQREAEERRKRQEEKARKERERKEREEARAKKHAEAGTAPRRLKMIDSEGNELMVLSDVSDALGRLEVRKDNNDYLRREEGTARENISQKGEFRPLTAYNLGYQWFSPQADDYVNASNVHPRIAQVNTLKHYNWRSVVDFAIRDRLDVSYHRYGGGDWKDAVADGFFFVTVGGKPVWADAIGQIPFAVDEFEDRLGDEGYESEHEIIRHVMHLGNQYGDGTFFGEPESGTGYDACFILRGALYASARYDYEDNWWSDTREANVLPEPARLGRAIDRATAERYRLGKPYDPALDAYPLK